MKSAIFLALSEAWLWQNNIKSSLSSKTTDPHHSGAGSQ
jgi:hypothetical protein